MNLGVDHFSLRFNEWDALRYIEYAQEVGLDVLHFSNLTPFQSLDQGYLDEVKQTARQANIEIEVGMGSICPTSTTFSEENGTAVEQLTRMIELAAHFDSPAVRCYLGSNADRSTQTPLAAHIDATIATCQAVREHALAHQVKIAVENHAGDLQARELRDLIERAGPDIVGACIDSGNPLWVVESPFVTLEILAPYVVMSHIRDTAVWPHPEGATAKWVAMGDGTVGIDEWSRRYMQQCPNTNFTLEIITSLPPRVLNFYDPAFWEIYPDMPAHEFARFLPHVQQGRPYTEPILTADWRSMSPAVHAALAEQQRLQLEKSIRYCREKLGI